MDSICWLVIGKSLFHQPPPEPLSATAQSLDKVPMDENDRHLAQGSMSKIEHVVDAIANAADRVLHHKK